MNHRETGRCCAWHALLVIMFVDAAWHRSCSETALVGSPAKLVQAIKATHPNIIEPARRRRDRVGAGTNMRQALVCASMPQESIAASPLMHLGIRT